VEHHVWEAIVVQSVTNPSSLKRSNSSLPCFQKKMVPILRQTYPVHILTSHFPNSHFNITFTYIYASVSQVISSVPISQAILISAMHAACLACLFSLIWSAVSACRNTCLEKTGIRRGAILATSLSAARLAIRFLAHLHYQHRDTRWCTMMKINAQILLCACALYAYLFLHINDDVWQDSTLCLHLHLHPPSSFLTPALSARPRAFF
jgi:hypothetical protein